MDSGCLRAVHERCTSPGDTVENMCLSNAPGNVTEFKHLGARHDDVSIVAEIARHPSRLVTRRKFADRDGVSLSATDASILDSVPMEEGDGGEGAPVLAHTRSAS
jgi:hypothetical protein